MSTLDLGDWSRFIDDMRGRSTSLDVPLNTVADGVLARMDETFEAQAAPSGEAWETLKDATNLDRIRLGFPAERPIHERTGTLRESFDKRPIDGGVEVYTRDAPGKFWGLQENRSMIDLENEPPEEAAGVLLDYVLHG